MDLEIPRGYMKVGSQLSSLYGNGSFSKNHTRRAIRRRQRSPLLHPLHATQKGNGGSGREWAGERKASKGGGGGRRRGAI